ncbi:MAG: hypothetical protein IPM38_02755 [Ignavibacteria bacterium]|nr:hypothetical protein [Ignavibacteria bacterium]
MNGNILNTFSLFQKLDYRDKENSGLRKITGIIIAYLFSNTLLSYNFSLLFDERSYIIMCLTTNLFLISMIVINDFDNLFLSARIKNKLDSFPLKSADIFKAKFLSAVVFLFIFISVASVPQLVFFYLTGKSFIITLSFFFVNILFCYFAIGLITLNYSLILLFLKKGSPVFLALFQVLFFAFVFYTSGAIGRNTEAVTKLFNKIDLTDIGFVNFLPQTYFSLSVYDPFWFFYLLAGCLIVLTVLFRFIAVKYNSLFQNLISLRKKKSNAIRFPEIGKSIKTMSGFLTGGNTGAATFLLVKDHLKNSPFLRLKYIPLLFIPVVVVLIGFITNPAEFLFFQPAKESSWIMKLVVLPVSPAITMTLFMCARLLISNSKIADENSPNTKWIFDSLPARNVSSYIKGANSFIYFVLVLPMIFLIFILLSFAADLLTVNLNLIFISTAVLFVISVTALFDKTLPFTLESSKFNSATKFLEVILSVFIGLIIFLIQIFIFQNIIFVLSAAILFIAVSFILNRN